MGGSAPGTACWLAFAVPGREPCFCVAAADCPVVVVVVGCCWPRGRVCFGAGGVPFFFSLSSISFSRASRASSSVARVWTTCFLWRPRVLSASMRHSVSAGRAFVGDPTLAGHGERGRGGLVGGYTPLINFLVEVGDAVLDAENVHQLGGEGPRDGSVARKKRRFVSLGLPAG